MDRVIFGGCNGGSDEEGETLMNINVLGGVIFGG